MTLFTAIRLLSAFAYAVLPYSAAYLFFSTRRKITLAWKDLFLATLWGVVLFVIVSIPFSARSFSAYCSFHALISLPAISWLALTLLRRQRMARPIPIIPGLLLVAAALVRISVYLPANTWLGWGDMRFHGILARAVLINNALPTDWMPFADIALNYPLGSHVLASFMAIHASTAVHVSLNALLCICGALSTGAVYLLSRKIMKSNLSALISAIAYGFIASAGSLDYARWGGLPNALAMTLLLLFVIEIHNLCSQENPSALYGPKLTCVTMAIAMTHHYTVIATGLFAVSMVFLTPLRKPAWKVLLAFCAGIIIAQLLQAAAVQAPSLTARHSSIFMFHEHPISLWEAAISLNPVFLAAAGAGMCILFKRGPTDSESMITAWFSSYLLAFVLLEYIYRLAVFAISGGSEFFTALTPSRLIADSAYPLAIAAGAIGLHPMAERFRPHLLAILCALGLTSSSLMFLSLQGQSHADVIELSKWIDRHTDQDTILIGNLDHLEQLSWRMTSRPPIPASEERNAKDLLTRRNMCTPAEWQAYSSARDRRCLFLLSNEALPDDMTPVYSGRNVSVCIWKGPHD